MYCLLVDQNERYALAAVAAGAELKVASESRAALDAALAEQPDATVLDPEQAELRKALGVG